MNYDWVMFDADDTLFIFDDHRGLQLLFNKVGLEFTRDDYLEYELINKELWKSYYTGKVSMLDIKRQRFAKWEILSGVSSEMLNQLFLEQMALIANLMPGARRLLDNLQGKVRLGIITNGMTDLQHARLEQTNTTKYFDMVVVSEEVGYAKPQPEIFDYAFRQMDKSVSRGKVLMVGDNLSTDIKGAVDFGISSCWFNENNHVPDRLDIKPDFEISKLTHVLDLLLK